MDILRDMHVGVPTGNSPVTNERWQVFPISPTGYYDPDEVPIINDRSYGKTNFTLSGHTEF